MITEWGRLEPHQTVCHAAKVHLSSSSASKSMWMLTEIPCCLDGNTIILLPELMFFRIRANLNDEQGADSVHVRQRVASSLFMCLLLFSRGATWMA